MPTPRLSKSRLLAFRQCPRRLWLELHRPELRDDSGAALRFRNGHEVGQIARDLVPEGRLIAHDTDLDAAVAETAAALAEHPRQPLFEATFRHDGVLVRADLLFDPGGEAVLVEVKSTASVKDTHIEDAAIQSHVVRSAGVRVAATHVAHVDTRWVYPGDRRYDGLLVPVDVSPRLAPLLPEVPAWFAGAQDVAAGPEPQVPMGEQCSTPYDCPFMAYCQSLAGPAPEYPVELLPGRDGKALARKLRAEGIEDLRAVPARRVPDGMLSRVHAATVSGRPYQDAAARRAIAGWRLPRYWLDFETIGFAVPRWPGTRPYQQIPFQWSCHVERRAGEFSHAHFLDLSGRDPRRACAEQLLATLGDRGAIVTYHASFERKVLLGLAADLPDLADGLQALAARVVDLEPVVKSHWYHPDMRGSFSIKAVLPTLAPGLDYGTLGEVRDGDAAQQAYLEATDPATSRERLATLHRDLLDYCRRDTEAMVAVAQALAR